MKPFCSYSHLTMLYNTVSSPIGTECSFSRAKPVSLFSKLSKNFISYTLYYNICYQKVKDYFEKFGLAVALNPSLPLPQGLTVVSLVKESKLQ